MGFRSVVPLRTRQWCVTLPRFRPGSLRNIEGNVALLGFTPPPRTLSSACSLSVGIGWVQKTSNVSDVSQCLVWALPASSALTPWLVWQLLDPQCPVIWMAETLGVLAPELPPVHVCAQSVLPALETRLDLGGKKVFVLQVASTVQVAVNKGFWKQIILGLFSENNFEKMLTHSLLLSFFFF